MREPTPPPVDRRIDVAPGPAPLVAGAVAVAIAVAGLAITMRFAGRSEGTARHSALMAAAEYGLRSAEITTTCEPTVPKAEKCYRISGTKDGKPDTIHVQLVWKGWGTR